MGTLQYKLVFLFVATAHFLDIDFNGGLVILALVRQVGKLDGKLGSRTFASSLGIHSQGSVLMSLDDRTRGGLVLLLLLLVVVVVVVVLLLLLQRAAAQQPRGACWY